MGDVVGPGSTNDRWRELAAALERIPACHVSTDEHLRRRLGTDLHHDGMLPEFVACPETVEALRTVVARSTEHDFAVVPRGGGMSYTAGYVADAPGVVLVDTRRLDRIVELSVADGYVTVEAGCTWAGLLDELARHGVRPTFQGPLSGAHATIGGAVSQSAIVWGAAAVGTSAGAVLSVAVVLADGTLVRTGADGSCRADGRAMAPFLRPYGPDLTGPFLGDCGALGIKATVTLALEPVPPGQVPSTHEFVDDAGLVAAMAELAARRLGTTIVATDAAMARQRLRRHAKETGGVPPADASVRHTLHVVVESATHAGAAAEAEVVRQVCASQGGIEVDPGPTRALLEARYLTMTSSIGPEGERWAPLHAMVPRSQAARLWQALRALESQHREALRRHEVTVGYLLSTVASQAIVIEPALYWPGSRRPVHALVLDEQQSLELPGVPDDPETLGFVGDYRAALLDLFGTFDAVHLQIGRTYPYADRREPAAWSTLQALKRHLDPAGLINPGVLGLPGS